MPFALTQDSEPEPDLAVVPGEPEDYVLAHPTRALLLVEVADTTLLYDRRKAEVYADGDVAEYWLVNLPDHIVEVYRFSAGAPFRLGVEHNITPLASGNTEPIPVRAFLR